MSGKKRCLPNDAASVPTAWPGSVVVCLGGGPSLTREDVDYCRGRAKVIAINNAYQLAPWADALYACDAWFWRTYSAAQLFAGPKYALEGCDRQFPPGIQVLRNTGVSGLEADATGVRHGHNSGYQAIGVAAHYGATRIVLLGYDMQFQRGTPSHWFGEHRHRPAPPVQQFIPHFASLVQPLAARGITVVNASRETALTCFPRMSLEDALRC